jgi:ring-1,2-phenylacetyl-CoA epoxidase subunit PaaA
MLVAMREGELLVRTVDEFHTMPDEYRELALRQMLQHTERELSGADDYLEVFLPISPNAYERKVCCERAAEELDHYLIGSSFLSTMGLGTDYMMSRRLTSPASYLNPQIRGAATWHERGLFSFLGEDAVLDHIKEMSQSSFLPWAESLWTIIRDEKVHVAHGERIVREFLQTDEGRDDVQAALDRVWPLVLTLFGRIDAKRSARYLRWGLRKKTNGQALDDFVSRTVPKLRGMGLAVPG